MRCDASEAIVGQSVQAPYELDDGPGRHRIGLIALATDHATERDFMNMRPCDDVVVYTSRLRNTNPCTVENLRTMGPLLTEATSLILPESRLDVVAYSCTSGTVVIGYDAVAANIRAARPGIPCVTPITAGLAAFEALGVGRVAVLTPYVDEVNQPMVRYLQEHGLDVVALTTFGMADDNHMAKLPPEAIHAAALEADRAEAEALFISCTAIRAVDALEGIERDLGKPVVSSIQALYWQSLRLAGYADPVPGHGRLLALAG
jgi:maleate isomerase